jgi:hypothetical protein
MTCSFLQLFSINLGTPPHLKGWEESVRSFFSFILSFLEGGNDGEETSLHASSADRQLSGDEEWVSSTHGWRGTWVGDDRTTRTGHYIQLTDCASCHRSPPAVQASGLHFAVLHCWLHLFASLEICRFRINIPSWNTFPSDKCSSSEHVASRAI